MKKAGTRNMKYREISFRGYARSVSSGTSTLSYYARIYLDIGPEQPCHCKRKLARLLKSRKINRRQYQTRMLAVIRLYSSYKSGVKSHAVDVSNPNDWIPVGENAHVRRIHKGSM